MKIITKDNYGRDLYMERVVAENVNPYYGEKFVQLFNDKYWTETSDDYLALVENDYKLYDGYAEVYGEQ